AQSPYVFLGLPPHATGGEIELAAKKLEATLAPKGLAIHSLFPLEEQQALIALIHKNRDDLLSTATRATLDKRLNEELARIAGTHAPAPRIPADETPSNGAAPPAPEPRLEPETLGEAQEVTTPALAHATPPIGSVFSGRVLKATREMHGLSLDDVARETKI